MKLLLNICRCLKTLKNQFQAELLLLKLNISAIYNTNIKEGKSVIKKIYFLENRHFQFFFLCHWNHVFYITWKKQQEKDEKRGVRHQHIPIQSFKPGNNNIFIWTVLSMQNKTVKHSTVCYYGSLCRSVSNSHSPALPARISLWKVGG